MKAAYLVKYGKASTAFEIKELEKPHASPNQVLIKVEAFGLNFADVQARLGLYKDAPPLPAILGYDVVGHIEQCGADVKHLKIGDRITALTSFGGYAQYAVADQEVTQKIPETFSPGVAVALATQYCTAYFLSYNIANIQENDHVLIHAAAGGVGTALIQMALDKNCIIFGTCSSSKKIEYLKKIGVQYPINYIEKDFETEIVTILGEKGLDAIFDPIGGISVKKGFRLLGAGGRIITFGVSSMNQAKNIFGKIKVILQFGLYHPIFQFLMKSRGMMGINMLSIAKENPAKIGIAMKEVIKLTEKGILKPYVGAEFTIDKLAEAHSFLESRKSIGKIVVKW